MKKRKKRNNSVEKTLEKDLVYAEKWMIQRKKFFIKLLKVILLIILLLIIANFLQG